METTSTNIQEEIKNANQQLETAFEQGNTTDLAELYTDKAMLLPTGFDIMQGKQAIQEFWQGAKDMGLKQLKLTTLELEQYEEMAVETGTYKLYAEGDQEVDHGKYLVVWKKDNSHWKLHKDIWNSSVSNQPA
jgi:ketosteroid isomerase-like protein